VLLTCLLACFSATAQETRDPNFGRQWVADNPFTLNALCLTTIAFDLDEYKQAGMNSLLSWKPRTTFLEQAKAAQYPIHVHQYAREGATPEFQAKVSKQIEEYPTIQGIIINDEPKLSQMRTTAEAMDWVRQQFPDMLVYCNAYPIGGSPQKYSGDPDKVDYSYGDYIRDFARILQPDVLMFDIYPFSEGGGRVSDLYFFNLSFVRDVALKAEIPYWAFIQSYETTNRRLPSESDLRMQLFSNLTYGYTGFSYFTYDVAFDRGLLEPDGTPNSAYTYAQKINPEVLHLGNITRKLISTDVRYITAPSAATPSNLPRWEHEAGGDPHITSITDNEPDTEHPTGLIGFFKAKNGKQYFMLTNLSHDVHLSPEDAARTFTIEFTKDIDKIYRISRATGEVETLPTTDGSLAVTLPGGTGDLFMYKP
jgi:hypothetical protein